MASFANIQHSTAVPAQAKEGENILQKQEEQKTMEQSAHGIYSAQASPGFAMPRAAADFTGVPIHPALQTGLGIQCCAKDGKPCSCSKCSARAANLSTDVAEPENTSEAVPEMSSEQQQESTGEQSTEPANLESQSQSTNEQAGQEQSMDPALSESEQTTEQAAEGDTASQQTLLAEDSSTDLSAGQMKKTDFLRELRSGICSSIEPILASVGQTTENCPYLNYWLDLYEQKTATEVEATVRRYAPASARARTAADYIAIVTQRAVRSAEIWAATGRLSGIPEGVPTTVPGQQNAGPVIMTKAKNGGARNVDSPAAVQTSLGEGRPLDNSVRSRMEPAFGMSFADVRMHADTNASAITNQVNARAFTVGNHVAFGSGEYQPGTVLGDALIAHELAHVVQQRGATNEVNKMESGDAGYNALEADADKAAAGVVSSLWDRTKDFGSTLKQNAVTSLRTGLRMQKCSSDGCVTGNLTAKTSGSLQGGWTVNDYLSGGLTWGALTTPGVAGAEGGSYKVQMHAPFSGRENLGVAQTMQHGPSNQAFLDGTASYLRRAPGSVRVGDVNPEPVLNADPFAAQTWRLLYKDGQVSFADVPKAFPGDQGYIDFVTTFHSKGTDCSHRTCNVTWRWTVDFTGANTTNTVAQQSATCT